MSNAHVNGYATEDSEPDFVDVRDVGNWETENVNTTAEQDDNSTSEKPEIRVNGVPLLNPQIASVQRSQTARSSLKSPQSRLKEQEDGKKRTISFNLHETKPQVSIAPASDEKLRDLFASSRWSTSSSDPDTPDRAAENVHVIVPLKDEVESSNDDIVVEIEPPAIETKVDKAKATHLAMLKNKSKSLKYEGNNKRSADVIFRRHRSMSDSGTQAPVQRTALRDSAIDLISDEENSEVYTAVSLAGTLKRGAQPVEQKGIKRKYVIIGGITGSVVAVTVIVILIVLLMRKS